MYNETIDLLSNNITQQDNFEETVDHLKQAYQQITTNHD